MKRAYQSAVALLAARDRTRVEIYRLLGARGFVLSDVKEAVNRLTEQGYLDDRRVATIWAKRRLQTHPMGPRRLKLELEARGIDGHLVSEVLKDLYEGGEEEAARRAVGGSWDRFRRIPAVSQTARMARFLDRRGFSKEIVWRLLREGRRPDRGNE